MKFGIVFLAALTVALPQQNVIISKSMLEYGKEISRGNYGTVTFGKLLYNGTSVPVVIKKDRLTGKMMDGVSHEIDALSILGNHPNIVRMYGVTESNEIVLEFMENGSLLDYVQKNPSLSRSELLRLCIEVCKGMVYMDQKGLIHRDLRARNCLIGSKMEVKVNDFGLTRRQGHTNDRAICSPRIKSPEVYLHKDRYSSKSDVWAFGLLMWEVFSFGDDVPMRFGPFGPGRHLGTTYDLPHPKGCPDEIYNVMRLCWQRNPNDRPSFDQLLSKLNEMYVADPNQNQCSC